MAEKFSGSMKPKTKICIVSVTVCVGLSLILLVCLTSAYFAKENIEPMCDPADTSGKERDCDSYSKNNDLLDDKDMSGKDQGNQEPDKMATVHKKNQNLITKGLNLVKSGFGIGKSKDEHVLTTEELFVASMLLSGVGDAMGYHGGRWEFNTDGSSIHHELEEMGGLEKLHLRGSKWIVSDDTVMHLATADALVEFGNETDKEKLYGILADHYVKCMKDMEGRAPGSTTMQATHYLSSKHTHVLPFNSRSGGCGAAMRAMCIGLRYPREEDLDDLIAVSVESGRLTHHNPTGYLGALASALFTSYAIQKKPIVSWGRELMREVLPKARQYIINKGREVDKNLEAWSYFEGKWKEYLEERQIANEELEPYFKPDFGVKARDQFYTKYSFSGWGGASGHDAPMIAYDALLGSNDSWSELCLRGMLHGGDSDSTGAIAAAWFGALYGFKGVHEKHRKDLEYRNRLETLGKKLYQLASQGAEPIHASAPQGAEPTHASIETRV